MIITKRMWHKGLCIAALIAFAAGYHRADAQEAPHFELLVMGKSWHFGHNDIPPGYVGPSYNDYNPGIGIEYRYPWGGFVGALTYYDSYRKQAVTAYGGYQLTMPVSSSLSVFAAVRAGYIHGSGWNGLAALPSVGVTYKRLTLEAEIVPKVADHGVNMIGLFARWRF